MKKGEQVPAWDLGLYNGISSITLPWKWEVYLALLSLSKYTKFGHRVGFNLIWNLQLRHNFILYVTGYENI